MDATGTAFLLRQALYLFPFDLLDLAVIMMVLGTRLIKADRFRLKSVKSCSSAEVNFLVLRFRLKNWFPDTWTCGYSVGYKPVFRGSLVAVTTMLF